MKLTSQKIPNGVTRLPRSTRRTRVESPSDGYNDSSEEKEINKLLIMNAIASKNRFHNSSGEHPKKGVAGYITKRDFSFKIKKNYQFPLGRKKTKKIKRKKSERRIGPKVSLLKLPSKELYVGTKITRILTRNSDDEGNVSHTGQILHHHHERKPDDQSPVHKQKLTFSMSNFYHTNTSQIAKEEDDFWRYDGDEAIVDRDFETLDNMGKGGYLASPEKSYKGGVRGKRKTSIMRFSRNSLSPKKIAFRERDKKKNVSFKEIVSVRSYRKDQMGQEIKWLKF